MTFSILWRMSRPLRAPAASRCIVTNRLFNPIWKSPLIWKSSSLAGGGVALGVCEKAGAADQKMTHATTHCMNDITRMTVSK